MTPVSSPEELQSTRGEMAARDRNRFLRAALVSGLFHATLIALLIGLWRPAPVEPPPVIPVTLAGEEGIAGAAGAGDSTRAPESHGNTAAAASLSSSPSPTSSTNTPPSATKSAPTKTAPNAAADTTPPPSPAQIASAEPTPAPQPTQALEPVPPRKPSPPRPQRPLRTAQIPHPSPTPAAPVATAPPKPLAPPAATPSAPSAMASTAANGGSQSAGGSGRAAAGAGRSDTGNGAPEGPGDDYLELVRDWIARFQRYPDEAITKREEGVVSVGFKFARDGAVLDVWIDKSSGYPLLDKAAIKMIRDASPLPKPPPRYKGDTLTLVMPERFRIGLFDRIFH